MARSVVCLVALLAGSGLTSAGPIDFSYRLRYNGVAPITLSSGADGSVSFNATGGMSSYASATDSASATLNYTITGTSPAATPSTLDVAVLHCTLFLKDALNSTEWMKALDVYITGTVADNGHNTNEFLDGPGYYPFSTSFWLTPDHKYTVDFDFLSTSQNNGTGQVSVNISAIEEQQPPPAPEPSTLVLAGLGFAVPFVRRLRNRKC